VAALFVFGLQVREAKCQAIAESDMPPDPKEIQVRNFGDHITHLSFLAADLENTTLGEH